MPDKVALVDTSLRDGQMSLWATNMTTPMMLPAVKSLDDAGFDAVEIIGSSFYKKCIRELREDPWERLRAISAKMRTPLRAIRSRHMAAFQTTPLVVSRLWMEPGRQRRAAGAHLRPVEHGGDPRAAGAAGS